jgi:hypothetical protein
MQTRYIIQALDKVYNVKSYGLELKLYIYPALVLFKQSNSIYWENNSPNKHIYLYASTVHMYCIYPAI